MSTARSTSELYRTWCVPLRSRKRNLRMSPEQDACALEMYVQGEKVTVIAVTFNYSLEGMAKRLRILRALAHVPARERGRPQNG
jgi:hypothetical protein